MNLLLIIDYQNDFVHKDGTLSLGEKASSFDEALHDYIKAKYKSEFDYIVYTKDIHDRDTWGFVEESSSFPFHCGNGEFGSRIYGKTGELLENLKNVICLTKSEFELDYVDIQLVLALADTITVCGVATDICVLQNATLLSTLKEMYKKTKITLKLAEQFCAGLTEEKHNEAVQYMYHILGFEKAD